MEILMKKHIILISILTIIIIFITIDVIQHHTIQPLDHLVMEEYLGEVLRYEEHDEYFIIILKDFNSMNEVRIRITEDTMYGDLDESVDRAIAKRQTGIIIGIESEFPEYLKYTDMKDKPATIIWDPQQNTNSIVDLPTVRELPGDFSKIYCEAEAVYALFTGYRSDIYTTRTFTESGVRYRSVDINGCTNLTELRRLCEKYFGTELTNELMSKTVTEKHPLFVEHKGELYRFDGYVALFTYDSDSAKDYKFSLESCEKGSYVVRVNTTMIENEREIPVETFCTYIVKENGEIQFTSFKLMVEVFFETLETNYESEVIQTIVSTPIVSIPMAHETFNNAENVFELESAENTGNSLSYKTDCHGTVYGPEDYTLENNLAYILNSSNNSILVYHENSVVKNIALQDFIATNIAVDDGTLYTIGTNMKVYKIDNSAPTPILDISTLNNTDGISDFKILDNKLMITTPEGNYGKTYIFDLAKVKSGQKNVPTVIEGRMIENGIYYYVLPLTEGDQLISNTCKLVIHYPDSTKEEVIINSEYGLVGVELLAVEDEIFCALISEVLSDSNYNIIYEKSLQFITKQGLTKLSYPLPAQAKGLDNPVKIIDNHIYLLHNDTTNTQIEILEISDEALLSDKSDEIPNNIAEISDVQNEFLLDINNYYLSITGSFNDTESKLHEMYATYDFATGSLSELFTIEATSGYPCGVCDLNNNIVYYSAAEETNIAGHNALLDNVYAYDLETNFTRQITKYGYYMNRMIPVDNKLLFSGGKRSSTAAIPYTKHLCHYRNSSGLFFSWTSGMT